MLRINDASRSIYLYVVIIYRALAHDQDGEFRNMGDDIEAESNSDFRLRLVVHGVERVCLAREDQPASSVIYRYVDERVWNPLRICNVASLFRNRKTRKRKAEKSGILVHCEFTEKDFAIVMRNYL